jgi:hypothetical protein
MRRRNSVSSASGTSTLNSRIASVAVAARARVGSTLEAAAAPEIASTVRRSGDDRFTSMIASPSANIHQGAIDGNLAGVSGNLI